VFIIVILHFVNSTLPWNLLFLAVFQHSLQSNLVRNLTSILTVWRNDVLVWMCFSTHCYNVNPFVPLPRFKLFLFQKVMWWRILPWNLQKKKQKKKLFQKILWVWKIGHSIEDFSYWNHNCSVLWMTSFKLILLEDCMVNFIISLRSLYLVMRWSLEWLIFLMVVVSSSTISV